LRLARGPGGVDAGRAAAVDGVEGGGLGFGHWWRVMASQFSAETVHTNEWNGMVVEPTVFIFMKKMLSLLTICVSLY
jgi:hypothetical protein